MSNHDPEELQRADEWDLEHAEPQRAPRAARAVVSVAFRPGDFAVVAAAARQAGQPTSQFIRHAALAAARSHGERAGAREVVVGGLISSSGALIGPSKDVTESIRRHIIDVVLGRRTVDRPPAARSAEADAVLT